MSKYFHITRGDTPLLISVPHSSQFLPNDLARRMTPAGQANADTDWHVDTLFDFASALGAGLLVFDLSRYVIDLNQPLTAPFHRIESETTAVIPTETLTREPIYLPGQTPDSVETMVRQDFYWKPYHKVILTEMQRVREQHGIAILLDAHSSRSEEPNLFPGRLPDLTLCTENGTTADRGLVSQVMKLFKKQKNFTSALDERIPTGFAARNYGRPGEAFHALHLEIAQRAYMTEEPPFAFDLDHAQKLKSLLLKTTELLLDWATENAPAR